MDFHIKVKDDLNGNTLEDIFHGQASAKDKLVGKMNWYALQYIFMYMYIYGRLCSTYAVLTNVQCQHYLTVRNFDINLNSSQHCKCKPSEVIMTCMSSKSIFTQYI